MVEIDREMVIAHRILRPIAGSRQVTPDRIAKVFEQSRAHGDYTNMAMSVGARVMRNFAIRNYEHGLQAASWLTGREIIGAGLEVIVEHLEHSAFPNAFPVRKYATRVNGNPRQLAVELPRRQELAEGILGDFIVPTTYGTAGIRGSKREPTMIVMRQPLLKIVGDGETDPVVADQRGEFKQLATKLAVDHQLYVDVCPGHGNLVVAQEDGQPMLRLVDTTLMAKDDSKRFFVNFPPMPAEEMRWIGMLAA